MENQDSEADGKPPQDALSLRPATEDDLAALTAIEARLQTAPWTEAHFRAEMAKPYSQAWVLTDDETDEVIHGYVVFWLMPDACQVLNIVVDLPYRGLGLAKRMLRKAIDAALKQEIEKAVLDVRKSNLPAVALYQSLGFTTDHVRKGFYSNGEDAYVMTLHIKSDAFQSF